MTPHAAKNKGRNFQQLVAAYILNAFPELTSKDVVSRPMGSPGEDIMLSTRACELFPWDIECKSKEAIAVYSWLEQSDRSEFPHIVFAKGNHKQPIVILYAEDFFRLYKNGLTASHNKKENSEPKKD